MSAERDWDEDEDDYDEDDYDEDDYDEDDYPYLDDRDHYREPDEPDWGYEEWRAKYEEHCIRVHGGGECNCRPSLRERLRQAAGDLRRWARNLRRDRRRDWDEPPF